MHELKTLIRERSERLSRCALVSDWLQDESIGVEHKLRFAPMAIDFIMGFRDFNRYFVMYPEPKNELERALNAHAEEDATHSELFLADWEALDVDRLLAGWAPRDLYWWMTCEETEQARRLDFELMWLTYHNPDPLLRFAIIESMEAAGNVFFTRTVPIADALEEATGRSFPYFGRYHLERETGHLQNADEQAFWGAQLSSEMRAHGAALVNRVFDIFEAHFDAWHKLARAMYEGRWRFLPQWDARAASGIRPDVPEDVSRYLHLEHPAEARGKAAELKALRQDAFDELWRTPFYTWVRHAWPGDFGRMVRYFLLQWVVDNWTCADYFEFDTTYPSPSSPLERGINRLSALYASEMKRRYIEWETLEFDDFTGWSVKEALRHYWLDERVEEHREVFADLRKLTFRYPKPLHRYWILKCFVRFGDALMHSLGVAMRAAGVKDEAFLVFSGQPERLHPDLLPDPEADRSIAELESQPVSEEDERVIREIIAETKEQEARRAAISWRIVRDQYYEALDWRWQARRMSIRHAPFAPAEVGL